MKLDKFLPLKTEVLVIKKIIVLPYLFSIPAALPCSFTVDTPSLPLAKLKQNVAVTLTQPVASWPGVQGGTCPLASECRKISEI